MFDDPKKELDALQAQLEAQEDWFRQELDSAKRMIGQQPEKPAAPAPAKKRAPRPEPIRQEPAPKKKKGIRGLVILALLELLGIGGIAAYWILVLL